MGNSAASNAGKTIAKGMKLPNVTLDKGFPPKKIPLQEIIGGKKVVMVGLPGAKGVSDVIVYCVNDTAVMDAWAKDQKIDGSIVSFYGDSGSLLTKEIGLELTHAGVMAALGNPRCKRHAMIVDDMEVKDVWVAASEEDPAGDAKPEDTMASMAPLHGRRRAVQGRYSDRPRRCAPLSAACALAAVALLWAGSRSVSFSEPRSSAPCPSRREAVAALIPGLAVTGAVLTDADSAWADGSIDLIVGDSRKKAKYESREGGFLGANKFKKQTQDFNYTDLQSFLPKLYMARRSFEVQNKQLNDRKLSTFLCWGSGVENMGIKGLMKFLQDSAPKAVKEQPSQAAYTGRTVAIDASMCLYQFLIMIRENRSGTYNNLTNEEGQVTSHIIGMLTRTIRLMESGIKPVYVFDGKPPEMKLLELEQRRAKRQEAQANLQAAMEAGDSEQILKSTKATVKVTKEQNEETKKLLRLMGVPVVDAPSEAEATCAALCRDGKVFAAATEDADCLTFGTKILVRNLMAAESQKKTILEVNLALVLEQLNITMDQFIDFCILCGCDYCDTLKGVGPSTAIKLLMQHGTLEKVLEALGPEKVPANFRFEAARMFFKECE
ncbi:FEN1-A, partial [Symbiodinium necroappetens]